MEQLHTFTVSAEVAEKLGLKALVNTSDDGGVMVAEQGVEEEVEMVDDVVEVANAVATKKTASQIIGDAVKVRQVSPTFSYSSDNKPNVTIDNPWVWTILSKDGKKPDANGKSLHIVSALWGTSTKTNPSYVRNASKVEKMAKQALSQAQKAGFGKVPNPNKVVTFSIGRLIATVK